MPLATGIVDGQAGHANLHNEERSTLNTVEVTANQAKTAAATAQTTADGKYSKPTAGIPAADLTTTVQAQLTRADAANVRWLEWKGDPALTRPSTNAAVMYVWVKRDPALADPPIDATHMLQGVDLLLRAS